MGVLRSIWRGVLAFDRIGSRIPQLVQMWLVELFFMMPVTFFIDPDMANDRKYDRVTTITLSYTFFEARSDRAKTLLEKARRTPGVGQAPSGGGPGDKRRGG